MHPRPGSCYKVRMQSCKKFPQDLVGESGPMSRVRALVSRVAATDASVLVIGESGTGKEVVAQALHAGSSRAQREPFVAVNCGAIPANLIESELFGHEKGSFTGATRTHEGSSSRRTAARCSSTRSRRCRWTRSRRCCACSRPARYFRVGGTRELSTDVRIIAATNRKPASAVRETGCARTSTTGSAVFPIELPPLRERGDDVVELAELFLERTERRRRHREALFRRLTGRRTASQLAGQHPRAQARRRVRLHPRGPRRGPRRGARASPPTCPHAYLRLRRWATRSACALARD